MHLGRHFCLVELKSTVLAENAEGSHCHHCRQGEPGCGGGGATGLIVMTCALPQSLTVYHFVSLSHRTAKLPSISPPSFSSLLLPTSFVCMCTSFVCFHIFQCEIIIFLASLDRNVQHPKISFPQLMLKQNTTEESLHRWVLENRIFFSTYCSGVKGKKSIYVFFFCC